MSDFSGTVILLFSDIQGSTQLLKELGREEYGRVLGLHNEVLRLAFEEAGRDRDRPAGRLFFAVFRSAWSRAPGRDRRAARGLMAQEWPHRAVVKVRMGLHTGEATLGEDGYVGFAVHQAARIGDAGHGGQILLSSTTAGLVEHDLPRDATCATWARTASTGSTGRSGSTSSSSRASSTPSRRSRPGRRRRPRPARRRCSSARPSWPRSGR